MSKSKERAVIKDKIDTFGRIACAQKAIEECRELLLELVALDAILEAPAEGVTLPVTQVIVDQIAKEFADVEITVKETLFRIWPRMNKAYQKKRHDVFTKKLPQAIATAHQKGEWFDEQ